MNVIAGEGAAAIERLYVVYERVAIAVFVLVVGALLVAVVRKQRREPDDAQKRRLSRVVAVATGATFVTLFVLLFETILTGRALAHMQPSAADHPLTIEVIGHQWWWEVQYDDDVPARMVTTANEMHVPVGRTVVLKLTSRDVIHSFWIPSLHGKKDLTPGHEATLPIRADEPGVFVGQCAEFCGVEHALMRLVVVAEPEDAFERWLDAERAPSRAPTTPAERHGEEVFLAGRCPMCHTIRGTDAAASVAPELTHLASRRALAGNAIPNVRGHLAGWVSDPQGIKPGANMPANPLPPADLDALLAYLESLR